LPRLVPLARRAVLLAISIAAVLVLFPATGSAASGPGEAVVYDGSPREGAVFYNELMEGLGDKRPVCRSLLEAL
jgi:hypothetical protein